jgi:sporulation protein YlmC with PRC-barrel domain
VTDANGVTVGSLVDARADPNSKCLLELTVAPTHRALRGSRPAVRVPMESVRGGDHRTIVLRDPIARFAPIRADQRHWRLEGQGTPDDTRTLCPSHRDSLAVALAYPHPGAGHPGGDADLR